MADCIDPTPNRPLWRIMEAAYFQGRKPGYCDRLGYAAELLAIADWLVPEEPPYAALFPGERNAIDIANHGQRSQRQALRAKLLAEADRAEAGE
jgi:hypothetical protein